MITKLPNRDEMYRALVERDTKYEGVFFAAVKTTGVFCRPICPARKPRLENIQFFSSARDALAAGFRPCKRCRPLKPFGAAPQWVERAIELVEQDPSRRWTDSQLRDQRIDPARVRSWFKRHHGMTFHAFQRSRRLSMALGQISTSGNTTAAALDHGYESLSGFRDAFKQLFGEAPAATRQNGRQPIVFDRLLTPLGPMLAGANDRGLHLFEFIDRRMLETQLRRVQRRIGGPIVPGTHPVLEQLEIEIGEYFRGRRRRFAVPIVLRGTPFQLAVWRQLKKIAFGTTTSYKHIAEQIGRPQSMRAVGRANGDNRFAIILPCHRVVRADGSLCGYGGGLWRKRWLLEHESNSKVKRHNASRAEGRN